MVSSIRNEGGAVISDPGALFRWEWQAAIKPSCYYPIRGFRIFRLPANTRGTIEFDTLSAGVPDQRAGTAFSPHPTMR